MSKQTMNTLSSPEFTSSVTNFVADAVTLATNCIKLNAELDGRLMDTIGDIPYDLRRFDMYNRVFEEFTDETMTEELLREIFAKAFRKVPEFRYFEVYEAYFGNESDYGEGEQPTMVIHAIRKPTIEEANEFYKVDVLRLGAPITRICKDAKTDFDCSHAALDHTPVFGLDRPATLRDCGYSPYELPIGPKAHVTVWAKTADYASGAFYETLSADPGMLTKSTSGVSGNPMDKPVCLGNFIAACHGGLEPIPADHPREQ